jgi:hypothetical protein
MSFHMILVLISNWFHDLALMPIPTKRCSTCGQVPTTTWTPGFNTTNQCPHKSEVFKASKHIKVSTVVMSLENSAFKGLFGFHGGLCKAHALKLALIFTPHKSHGWESMHVYTWLLSHVPLYKWCPLTWVLLYI